MQKFLRCAALRTKLVLGTAMLLVLITAPLPVLAVQVENLYSAEVGIDPADPDSRDQAYERALRQVLVRVTGSEGAAVSPELVELFPNPARFVLQFRPMAENKLWIALDGAAIEKILRDRGLPVWGSERPLTLVWLAVDRGRGQRDLVIAENNDARRRFDGGNSGLDEIRQRAEQVAMARGLPIRFPTEDEVAQLDINLSDIWGGFHEPLIEASRNRGIASVLVGRARPGDAERSRWTYYSGSQRQQWNGDVDDALHLLADNLAGEFVISGNEPLTLVELTISNIRSATAYAAVQEVVASLPMIDDYRVKVVSGNEVRYAVRINGGARRLSTALNFKGQLEPLAHDPATGLPLPATSLHYAYHP